MGLDKSSVFITNNSFRNNHPPHSAIYGSDGFPIVVVVVVVIVVVNIGGGGGGSGHYEELS